MERKITVKGIGKTSVQPDLIILDLDLVTKRFKYDETLEEASVASRALAEAIGQTLDKDDLKTTDFRINSNYKSHRDKNGNYESIFMGYQCSQDFRVEFALDFEKLSQILSAISESGVVPRFDIRFSVADTTGISEDLLRNATANARAKAEILADASGVKLGDILDIDYNWGRLDIFSHTTYEINEDAPMMSRQASPHIMPEEIDLEDTVTFVWAIQ